MIVKQIKYPDGKEEFVTKEKYHELHRNNIPITLIQELEV